MSEIKMPPLGLKPKFIHDEQRLAEIRKAIFRYLDEFVPLDLKWIQEYNDLVKGRN